MRKLRLKTYLSSQEHFHFARTTFADAREPQPHTHDFLELFWVEDGRGWHWINGSRQELTAGMLIAIRPEDEHGFSAQPRHSFRIANCAFARSSWQTLTHRYSQLMNPFKSSDITDRTFRPSPPVWQVVMDHAVELDRGRSLLHLDRFLINVMSALADDRPAANHLALPSWLRDALATLDDPANIADVDTFVAAANRSPEHVARVVRQTLGTTPTDLVNAARVRRAAHRLVSTDDKILAIALDCGFNNLGHFYTIFRKQMGQTPRRYRVLRQNVLGVR